MNKKLLIFLVVMFVLFNANATLVQAQNTNFDNAQRVIIEEPVGINDTVKVSSKSKGLISVLVAMLAISLYGGYYLYTKEKQRRYDNQ